MTNHDYKKRNLFSGPHLAGLLLILGGIFAIISPYIMESGSSVQKSFIVGVIAMVIGIMIASSYTGTTINFKTNQFRKYTSLLGIKFGEWEPLPPIELIEVRELNYRATNTPNGITPTLSSQVTQYKVSLFDTQNRASLRFLYESEHEAKEQSELLAYHLKTKIISPLSKSSI